MGVPVAAIWRVRSALLRVPGAYTAFRKLADVGDGRTHKIPFGPLKGLRWRHDASLPIWYRVGLYEPDVAALIQRHLQPGGTYWDIGANAGYHVLVGARSVGQNGRVVAVEADPRVAELAEHQIQQNPDTAAAVTFLCAAVTDHCGTTTFAVSPNNRMSTLAANAPASWEKIEVEAITLDELLDRGAAPDLIKMDIEGGEISALKGGQRTLGEARPRLLLSVHGDEADRFCQTFTAGHDYEITKNPEFPQMLICLPR